MLSQLAALAWQEMVEAPLPTSLIPLALTQRLVMELIVAIGAPEALLRWRRAPGQGLSV